MNLSQVLTHHNTVFALFIYSISVMAALPCFVWIHDKLDHGMLQYCWDKIGMPLLRVFLIIGFILLVYPINFGLGSAPAISDLFTSNDMRSSYLINLIFLLTFIFPLLPVIGKWEEFLIPLQGILASMIIFNWLCQELEIKEYALFPGGSTLGLIVLIAIITHWLAKHMAEYSGAYLDNFFHREGFKILAFKAVVLIMQSPVIFIFGLSLGKQIQ